ncbi:MAG TPA: pantoate--beta-alanine ligase [Verrucomicrobiae bacterium]
MQRLALGWKTKGQRIGFVPTMGYLHQGHMSLVHRARRAVGSHGVVVASIYVNPTQFAPTEDLRLYPRDFPRDKALCREAGVDVLFYPTDAQMYPGKERGLYSTFVVEEALSRRMEGASRPTHFQGVTTIVAKLFNLVLPDVAVFGAKDFQQASIIQRMVQDLNFPVKIIVAPTVREPDGLAMSSRNKYLHGDLRAQALCLSRALQMAKLAVKGGTLCNADALRKRLRNFIEHQPDARVDYIEFFNPQTLQPAKQVRSGVQMALAVFLGRTRLIDNALLK